MRLLTIAVVTVLCAASGGCATTTRDGLSSATSTLTGGLVGGKPKPATSVEAPSAGAAALYLAWTAGDIGRQLDEADRRLAAETDFQALESGAAGVSREWQGAQSGVRGMVTPGPAYTVNQYACRDFVDVVSIDGRRETRRSTACRQPDGSWRPIS